MEFDYLGTARTYLDETTLSYVLEFLNGTKISIEFLMDMKAIIGEDKFIKLLKLIDSSEFSIKLTLNHNKVMMEI